MKTLTILIVLCCSVLGSRSQTTIPVQSDLGKGGSFGPAKIVVKLDPVSRIPIGNVPFDRNFIMRVYFLNATDIPKRIYLMTSLLKSSSKDEQLGFYFITPSNVAGYDASDVNFKYFTNVIDILMPPLLPNKNYSLLFITDQASSQLQEYLNIFKLIYDKKDDEAKRAHALYRKQNINPSTPTFRELKSYYDQNTLGKIFKTYDGSLNAASPDLLAKMKAVDFCIDDTGNQVRIFQNAAVAGSLTTEQYTVQANAALRIVAEAGVVFAGFQQGFNVATPYLGINISFRPFDSDISLASLVKNHRISFFQRFTVNLGLTLNSLAKTGYRSNLFGNYNVMTGFGFKFNHYVSLVAGGLIYNNNDPNPLLDKKKVGVAPYAGLSINLKIKDAIGDLVKLFTYGK